MESLYDQISREKKAHDEQQLRLEQERVQRQLEAQKSQRAHNTKIAVKVIIILVSVTLLVLLFYNHVGTYNEHTVVPNFLMIQFITITVCYLLNPNDLGSFVMETSGLIGAIFGVWMGILIATSTGSTFSMIISFLINPICGGIGGGLGGLVIGGIVRLISKTAD